MLIESDMIIALMGKSDWLKESAEKLFTAIDSGKFKAQVSSEVFHELYYVFSEYAPLSTMIGNQARLMASENLVFVDASGEIYLSALDVMNSYGLTSIFDAIYAATALSDMVPDKTIISTDKVYDRVSGLHRVDPGELKF